MFDMTRADISFAKFLCQGNWSIRVRGFCPAGPQALWREDQGLRDELGRGARRCHGGGDRRRPHVEAVDGDPACARQVEGEEERRWRDGRQQGVGSEIWWKEAEKESEGPRWTTWKRRTRWTRWLHGREKWRDDQAWWGQDEAGRWEKIIFNDYGIQVKKTCTNNNNKINYNGLRSTRQGTKPVE